VAVLDALEAVGVPYMIVGSRHEGHERHEKHEKDFEFGELNVTGDASTQWLKRRRTTDVTGP